MWQYITLMKRIYLIDCPGVVPPSNNNSAEDILLRGVVRVENVENPEQYITTVLKRTKPQHIERTYDVRGFSNATQFLQLLARKGGRLLKGGEADVDGAAKMVLNDFLRGKIPWFTPPPVVEGEEKGIDGRKGALGEMGRTSKPGDGESVVQEADTVMETTEATDAEDDDDAMDDDDFEGFQEDDEDEVSSNTPSSNANTRIDGQVDVDSGGIALDAPG